MQPVITTKKKQAQLRYDLPHRVHDAHVYPVKAPNGSTIVVYGHETGVGVLWRGGRPLKKTSPKAAAKPSARANGTSQDVIVIDLSDDEDETPKKQPARPMTQAEFEDEEEELDPDQPYPSIVQNLRLSLNTEALHIAVPRVPQVSPIRPADSIPQIFQNSIVFAVACADYTIRIITLPLPPPSDSAKQAPLSAESQYGEEILKIHPHAGHLNIPRGLDLAWTSRNNGDSAVAADDGMDIDDAAAKPNTGRRRSSSQAAPAPRLAADGWDLLVASHSSELGASVKIWRFALSETSIKPKGRIEPFRVLSLRHAATKIAFNSAVYPKERHSQLLITDRSGTARVYDPFAINNRRRTVDDEHGAYVALFRTGFDSAHNTPFAAPALAARKPILDAAWATDGNSILALLADGEWGIWDVTRLGPKPPADPTTFSARGFIGLSEEARERSAPSPKSRSTRGSLAPMTPNTRRTREEKLFQPTSSVSIPPRGGLSVASLVSTTGGAPEESALIWYGADVYRMPNIAQAWARNSTGLTTDGLPRPSLSQIKDLNLYGEAITSVALFDTTVKDARMAIPRDVLISTDHRLHIITQVTEPLGRNMESGFEIEDYEDVTTRKTDQVLLARGELDLGGMDRLLEDLEGGGGESGSGQASLLLGNPRRVLFASSSGA